MSDVTLTRQDHILIITINRPEARNAVNRAVAEQLAAAIDELDASPELRVAVLTGAGNTFCAGMDLKAFLRGEIGRIDGRGFGGLTEALPSKPLIAAVEGHALAGGFELALACDLIVAAKDARFGLPEVKRALVANAGGLLKLPQQVPYRIAMEMILTGESYTADQLAIYGLINRITDPGAALGVALELAGKITSHSPLAVQTSKKVVQLSRDWPREEMFTRQREITAPIFVSNDAREGATAFAEKRAPVWRGN